MKALKLTPKQKELFDHLSAMPGAILFKHVKPSGTICYRILDVNRNPVMNVRSGLVDELIEKDVLERNGMDIILKATTEKKPDYRNIGLVKESA